MADNPFAKYAATPEPEANPFARYASLNPSTSRLDQFAAPGLPQEMPPGAPTPQPKLLEEGMLISAWENPDKSRSLGLGSVTRPIVDGIKNALPAASRYQSFDPESTDEVVKAVVPPATVLGPGSAGGMGWAGRPMAGKPTTALSAATDDAATAAPPKPNARMSPDQLKEASRAAYKEADDAGVIFTPAGVARVSKEAKEALTEFGYHPSLQPRVKVALDELDRLASGNVTFKGLDTLRKITKAASASIDPSERKAGQMIIDKIDDLMANSRPFETLTGDAPKAAKAMTVARELWGRARRTELLEEAVVRADRRAGSTGSGGNVDNATRQNLRGILDNPKKARMFSEAERKQIEEVVIGTKGLNTLRRLGKLSPEGNGLMLALHVTSGMAAAAANPLMAAGAASAALGGAAAKRLADRGTNKAVERLITDVSSGAKRDRLRRAMGGQ